MIRLALVVLLLGGCAAKTETTTTREFEIEGISLETLPEAVEVWFCTEYGCERERPAI